jgi:hypothetical protein
MHRDQCAVNRDAGRDYHGHSVGLQVASASGNMIVVRAAATDHDGRTGSVVTLTPIMISR